MKLYYRLSNAVKKTSTVLFCMGNVCLAMPRSMVRLTRYHEGVGVASQRVFQQPRQHRVPEK